MPKPTSIGSKSANFVVGIDSNPLAPPKLNIGLSQSSISSRSVVLQTPSTQPPGWNIPLIAANLNQNNLPPWLSRLISLADQIPSTLRNAYSAIEEREAARLRPASKYIASHYATKVCHNSQNTRRNRYSDIIPYDRNRVVLKYPIAPDLADYINASYITAPYNVRSYIATQGPKPQTSCDFWQMVWEQNTAVIVMLTQEEEKGRTKCHRYWPDASGKNRRVGKERTQNFF